MTISMKGFIRSVTIGWTAERQASTLRAAGLPCPAKAGPVFVDDREAAIAGLAPGEALVVASACCLGHPEADVLAALEQIGAAGAFVIEADTGNEIRWHPDAQKPLAFALRAGSANRKAIAARARKARVASGNLGQKPVDWDADTIDRLDGLLADGKMTREEMAVELGMSRATLQRKLRKRASRA